MNASDSELIGRYAREGDEAAFTELVRRHVDLVHSAALRQVDGQTAAAAAEDIAQAVFTQLARKARALTGHTSLSGWLYSATRLVALQHRRTESRRLHREHAALDMNPLPCPPEVEPDWTRLRPVLDEAMHDLAEADREAVLLRYFEKRPLAEVGARLGVSENAARMRVDRAVDRLREALAQRGITSTVGALGVALSVQAVSAAPLGLAERIAPQALTTAAMGTAGFLVTLWLWLTSTTGKLATGALLVAVGVSVAVVRSGLSTADTATKTPARAATTANTANQAPSATPAAAPVPPADEAPGTAPSPAGDTDQPLNIRFLTADTGEAIPGVVVGYRGWTGGKFTGRRFVGTRDGTVHVKVVAGTTRLELTSQVESFADKRLQWTPGSGESIPANLTVRLERGVRIAGRVLDPDGQPVSGAKVGWNSEEHGADLAVTESNAFGWIEVATDAEGHWEITRIAADMVARIHGGATHPEYQPSAHVSTAQDAKALAQLRDGTHVFQLGRATTVRGIVVNEQGEPIPGASVLVGQRGFTGSREGTAAADGVFAVTGCALGKTTVTAEAPDYAAKTIPLELAAENEPVRLVLAAGKPLRIRVVNSKGEGVPKAWVWLNTMDPMPRAPGEEGPVLVQAEFNGKTDAEGRIVWKQAPAGEHHFDIAATGYMRTNHVAIPADNEEHAVVLSPALVVHGRVTDATTGKPIPKFRVAIGWPQLDHSSGTARTTAQFSSIERFWLTFTDGQYRHTLEEEVITGGTDHRCVFRFDAEGYTTMVSRPIAYSEGAVTLDVALKTAEVVKATVLSPDGRPVPGAKVGLVRPGAGLRLHAGDLSVAENSEPGALKIADAQGEVTFDAGSTTAGTSAASIGPFHRIIAAHASGYADTTLEAMQAGKIIQLQPWARIEGRFVHPGVRVVSVNSPAPGPSELVFDVNTTTDGQGRFVLERVPFGRVRVAQVVISTLGNGTTGSQEGTAEDLELAPGQTAEVVLGRGYRVAGRVVLPDGFKAPPWASWWAQCYKPVPIPAEFRDNPEAMAKWAGTPEGQRFARSMVPAPVAIGADGNFSAEGLQPGSYRLEVILTRVFDSREEKQPAGPELSVMKEFTIPAEPADGELDLGALQPIKGR